MNCPDETLWSEWMSGTLSPRRRDIVAKHAADCARCRERLERWEAEESMIREALQSPIDWRSLARRVHDRLQEDKGNDD